MCYIFRCCGWMLDVIQRIFTFALACCMCWAICIGVTIAAMAGVAYGYNYSVAEFLSEGTSNGVSVYVRRGQFWDKPDSSKESRRRNSDDLFSSNLTDYEDRMEADSKPLSDTWRKALDSKKYAERLSKYSRENIQYSTEKKLINLFTGTRPTRVNTVAVKPMRSRKLITSKEDIAVVTSPSLNTLDGEYYQEADRPVFDVNSLPKNHKEQPETKSNLNNSPKSFTGRWDTDETFSAFYREDVEVDNFNQKPV